MIFDTDTYLEPYKKAILGRHERYLIRRGEIAGHGGRIADAVNNHLFYGVHRVGDNWVFREWAPNATSIYIKGDFNNWEVSPGYRMTNKGAEYGNWCFQRSLSGTETSSDSISVGTEVRGTGSLPMPPGVCRIPVQSCSLRRFGHLQEGTNGRIRVFQRWRIPLYMRHI